MSSSDTELYFLPEELFRIGNTKEPRLTNVRTQDVNYTVLDHTRMVVADGNGISLYNEEGLRMSHLTGTVWKLPEEMIKDKPLPAGLKIVEDKNSKGHFMIAPTRNMPLEQYKGLLEKLAVRCTPWLSKSELGAWRKEAL
ncbi:Tse2 family ADP-ribosyltransferase toxin [Microbulbifer sp. ZKSA002]|uniref:Tse2 family ADP-ribosyltransferase toxin n=1 Tax=Microbulbifer sp. ZKSA002 TaxID=3243388 RepID=UPI00403954FB